MENIADDGNGFPDLLSAALNESGLADDWCYGDTDSAVPLRPAIPSEITQGVRLPVSATTSPVGAAAGKNGGVKKIIVRAVTPQSLMGKKIILAGSSSSPLIKACGTNAGTSKRVLATPTGNIRVIRVPSNQLTSLTGRPVTKLPVQLTSQLASFVSRSSGGSSDKLPGQIVSVAPQSSLPSAAQFPSRVLSVHAGDTGQSTPRMVTFASVTPATSVSIATVSRTNSSQLLTSVAAVAAAAAAAAAPAPASSSAGLPSMSATCQTAVVSSSVEAMPSAAQAQQSASLSSAGTKTVEVNPLPISAVRSSSTCLPSAPQPVATHSKPDLTSHANIQVPDSVIDVDADAETSSAGVMDAAVNGFHQCSAGVDSSTHDSLLPGPTTQTTDKSADSHIDGTQSKTDPVTNSSEDEDMDDVDIFSRALLDLVDTNKKAAKIEATERVKQKPVVAVTLPKSALAGARQPSDVSGARRSVLMAAGLTATAGRTSASPISLLQQPCATASLQASAATRSMHQPGGSVQVGSGPAPASLPLPVRHAVGAGPLGQTIVRIPQTSALRLPIGHAASTIRLAVSHAGGTIRLAGNHAGGTIRLIGNQTSGTIRLPVNHTGATIRLPVNHTGATIRLPVHHTGATIRAPLSHTSGGNRVPVGQPGNRISMSVVGNTLVHLGGQCLVAPPGGGASRGASSVLTVKRCASPSVTTVRHSVVKSLLINDAVKRTLSDKALSRLWVNEDIRLKMNTASNVAGAVCHPLGVPLNDQELEEETEELGHAETYANYMPVKSKIGERHPDPVVETNSLSSVEPHDIWYNLSISETVIDYGYLSALQLEAIIYACQKHKTILPSGERAGYLIGDGAGVGKGRTIAGIIQENYLQGRKRALWLSVSNDLRVDAERDLRDIGANKIEVYPLNKFKYAKISSHVNGGVKKGVIFSTYSSLIGESQSECKYRTRLKQLIHWLGPDFDGPIIFDECHKAKNLCPVGTSKPTKTGMTVVELQNRLPKARIVYASATGATEVRNMAYMTRLGLWGKGTPFKEFNDFIQAIEKRGVGAMELVAMDLKLRGMYIARQLSFQGVSFRIEEIPIETQFKNVYNSAVKLWVEVRAKFQAAADLIDAEQRMKKGMWAQFWSAHQRFFKYLCISSKVPHCIKLARDAIKNGKCVVIGLQSTGEARTLEQLEDCGGELTDFVSTAKGVMQTLVEKHFPAPDRKKTSDLFGGNLFEDSPNSSPVHHGSKRKKDTNSMKKACVKRHKSSWSDDSSEKSASDSDALSADDSEPNGGRDSDEFNPFGAGSDSDDDPWLKRQKKIGKKKEKRKRKSKKKPDADSDDNIDSQFDKALEAAGLMGKSDNSRNPFKSGAMAASDGVAKAIAMKDDLLLKIEKLGEHLPPNTLDELIDSLGGSDAVAEMTGRKGRVVTTADGSVQYESRSETDAPLEILNLTEKQRFMDGEKDIAIISEAASSGISLQADRRVLNQKRRVHITLELPWSADRAIQQFGRTHRSNQVSAPEYLFLISELAGERRFACTVAKRLESLGALTHGDRRATETRDLSRFNIDNKYGRAALETMMKSIAGQESPMVSPSEDYSGNFYKDARLAFVGVGLATSDEKYGIFTLEKEYNHINKFLNRLLGIEVELQNCLFKYFMDTLTAIILQAKRNGHWDMGILDLGSGGEEVKRLQSKTFVLNVCGTTTKTELHTFSVERGMPWHRALEMWEEHSGSGDGFYLSVQSRGEKRLALLAVAVAGKRRERLYAIHRPNTRLQPRYELLSELTSKNRKVLPDEAKSHWQAQHSASATMCTHAYWGGSCKKGSLGQACEIGLRSRTYHVLSGSVLSVWTKVENVLASVVGAASSRMQLIRLRTDDGKRIVGCLIPASALAPLIQVLSQSSSKLINTQHAMLPSEMASANRLLSAAECLPVDPSTSEQTASQPIAQPTNTRDMLSMPMLL